MGWGRDRDEARQRKREKEKTDIGKWGEEEAVRYLKKNGYRVKDRNVRFARLGEIDIVAERGAVLVFVEVKTRQSRRYGFPEESVTASKARHLLQMAEFYLKRCHKEYSEVRIDVIALEKEGKAWSLHHLENVLTDG